MIPALIAAGANLAGSLLGARNARESFKDNVALQREFAQNGIRWKVEDAKAAGVHPLYALGANTMSFSPVAVSDGLAAGVSAMGQDIGRAVQAATTAGERASAAADSVALRKLSIERAGLENDLLRSQIARLGQGQVGPPMPGGEATAFGVRTGDVQSTEWQYTPSKVTAARPDDSGLEAGPPTPAYKEYSFGPLGNWRLLGSQAAESMEDMDLLKYAAVAAGNFPGLVQAFKYMPQNLIYQWLRRPDWVRRIEEKEGPLLPSYDAKGRLGWVPLRSYVQRLK